MRACCSVFLYTICYISFFGFYSQNPLCKYMGVWQKPKTPLTYFTKLAFLLGAPAQIQHDLWKQPNISHMWLERETEESLFHYFKMLLNAWGVFSSASWLGWIVSLNGVFFNFHLFARKSFIFPDFLSFQFCLSQTLLLLFRTLTAQTILFIPLYSSQIFLPWWLAPLLTNSL